MLPQISQDGLSYERLRLLLDVNNAIVTHLDLHDLLHAISETLRECVPHDFTALAIYDEETKQLRAHAIEAGGERGFVAEGTPLPMQGTFAGVAISTRHTEKQTCEREALSRRRDSDRVQLRKRSSAKARRSKRSCKGWSCKRPWVS